MACVVDHLVPHRGDRLLFWDASNWQSLCESCHNRKTARADGGFGREAPQESLLKPHCGPCVEQDFSGRGFA